MLPPTGDHASPLRASSRAAHLDARVRATWQRENNSRETKMNDQNNGGGRKGGDGKFGNKGHRFIAPSTKPSQRPKPQPPKPDPKKK